MAQAKRSCGSLTRIIEKCGCELARGGEFPAIMVMHSINSSGGTVCSWARALVDYRPALRAGTFAMLDHPGLPVRMPLLTGNGLESDWPSALVPQTPEQSQAQAARCRCGDWPRSIGSPRHRARSCFASPHTSLHTLGRAPHLRRRSLCHTHWNDLSVAQLRRIPRPHPVAPQLE
jgi:hypothetical protein